MYAVTIITDQHLADQLHDILHEAFLPFSVFYTDGAFAATVVSAETLKARMASTDYTVYGGYVDDHLAGTASTTLTESGELYFMSMAVSPKYAGQGSGRALLLAIEEEAMKKKCTAILLETYEPLHHAIKLYENFGFHRTGRKRDYSGIEIFEMKKLL